MANSERTPARDRGAFYCPRCGVFAKQTWYPLQRRYFDEAEGMEYYEEALDAQTVAFATMPATLLVKENLPTAPSRPPVERTDWAMAECGSCEEFSTWRGTRLMYPAGLNSAPPPSEDMPKTAKLLYVEAAEVVGISPRAGTALARATLEVLLKELDPTPARNLAARIERIEAAVSSSLAQMLTIIRHSGNMALHVREQDDDLMVLVLDPEQEEIVSWFFVAINDLVDELITRPARVAELFEKVPKEVRDRGQQPKDKA